MTYDKKQPGYEPSPSGDADDPTAPSKDRPLDAESIWAIFRPEAPIDAETFRDDGDAPGVEPGPIFLRPRLDPEGEEWPIPGDPGEIPDPPDPCARRPHVSPPQVAAQIRLVLGGIEADCPSAADLERIRQAVRSQFARVIRNPEVRVACINRLLTIAAWPAINAGDSCERMARERGFAALNLIHGEENFGFFLNSSLIRRQAFVAFEAGPKRLSANGAPSRSGPIHLTRLDVRFDGPDRVRTLVHGFDTRPWPDVGFTLTITDLLDDDLSCDSSSSLDTHGAWKAVLGGVLLGGATFFLPQLFPLTFFALAGDIDAALNQPSSDGEEGVGCRALGLVPVEIPLPDDSSLGIRYTRSQVTSGGIFAGGTAFPSNRTPEVTLFGPERLAVEETARSTFAVFRAVATQTFGTVSFRWSGSSGVIFESPTAGHTKVTFARGDRTAESPPFTRTVRITVSDQDGFEVTLSREVTITILRDDELPPVCRVKPDLPQCLPPVEL